tara:strand:+ start:479 stop:1222 length:744 start_codon:yes stop_codon:yes gene_type:complete
MTAEDWPDAAHRLATVPGFRAEDLPDAAWADWTMLADLAGKTVWDISEGPSLTAVTIARTAAYVVASNPDEQVARCMMHAARLSGRECFDVVASQPERVPVRPAGVDHIVLGGALERLPRDGKIERLERLAECLAPGGSLLFTADNRFSPVRSGRIRGAKLASESGYRTMLRSAGFGQVDVSYAFLDTRKPRFVASEVKGPMLRQYLDAARQGGGLRSRLGLAWIAWAQRLGLAGTFCPAYVVRATR